VATKRGGGKKVTPKAKPKAASRTAPAGPSGSKTAKAAKSSRSAKPAAGARPAERRAPVEAAPRPAPPAPRAAPRQPPPVPPQPRPETRPAAASRVARPAPSRPAPPPSLFERAKALRDLIEESKLAAADPWTYTAKARVWVGRAQGIVDEVAKSQDGAELEQKLKALRTEIQGDADFQEARRRA